MNVRNYKDFGATNSAGMIAMDVVRYGKSEGWCGDLDDLEEIQNILTRYNIYYVNDMSGEWQYVKPE